MGRCRLDVGRYALDTHRERILRERPRDSCCDSSTACPRIDPIAELDEASFRVKVVEGPAAEGSLRSQCRRRRAGRARRVWKSLRKLVLAEGRNVVLLGQLVIGKGACEPLQILGARHAQDEIVDRKPSSGKESRNVCSPNPCGLLLTGRAHALHLAEFPRPRAAANVPGTFHDETHVACASV